ncbi:MAG: cytochrome b/b6 domain-containing protein [Rhodocyclales bacterium]|nr:cytochrome b/b6 domain-containing protein [Rhodocyclales bacterium]
MPSTSQTVRVWDLPTRLFHWSLAASFLVAFITAESEKWRDIHVLAGYGLAGLIAFRVLWGFVGSRHARFADFLPTPGKVVAYLESLLAGRPRHYLGHNPAGAVAIFLLLAGGLIVAASGYATYNEIGGHLLEEVHDVAANGMMALVIIHLAGVVVSSWLHHENLVKAMITGRKQTHHENPAG